MQLQLVNQTRFNLNKLGLLTIVVAGLLLTPSVNAEITLGLFAGQSFVDNGDLNLKQGYTHLNFKDVSWEDNSFKSPIFYGARMDYWFNDAPNWGGVR
ncbi:MAG: hypothetical protein QX198_06720 [Methylococcaceae bacterium]